MWVIFEGLDKAGKTTLEWEFLKATNFKHVVVDRGPVGYMVFDELFGRDTEWGTKNFIKQAKQVQLIENFMVVYCKVSPEIAMQRLAERGETCPYDYELAQKLYDTYVNCHYDSWCMVTVDTNRPVARCVDKILSKLKEVSKGEL